MSYLEIKNYIREILKNQTTKPKSFAKTLFASYRYNRYWRYRRADPNLFFSASTAFTLQRLEPYFREDEQELAVKLTNAAIATYPAYQNKDGLQTYNFYTTKPSRHFPNGWLLRYFRHFKLPDDIDDTALVYLTTKPTPADLDFLQRKLAQHANRTTLTIQNTFPEYRELRAYSTWFGKRMPIEFDACAMANMLYCVYEYGLPLDVHAQDSLSFLASIVETDRYQTHPFVCAHNYATTPLIAYHIARLIAAYDPVPLQPIRQKLIKDMWALLLVKESRLERMLLSTALLRLGEHPPLIQMWNIERGFPKFSFFIAGMLSSYQRPFARRLAPHPFWQMRWQCDDHCRILMIEYLLLMREL